MRRRVAAGAALVRTPLAQPAVGGQWSWLSWSAVVERIPAALRWSAEARYPAAALCVIWSTPRGAMRLSFNKE